MIYSLLDVDVENFSETKQWYKDEEEVQGCIDNPSQNTQRQKWGCATFSSFFFKMVPLFSVPLTEPQSFNISAESSNSVNLSWEAIPIGKCRGFLSHYSLCSLKINSEQKDEGPTFHFHHDYVAIGEEPHKSPKPNLCGCADIFMFFSFMFFFSQSAIKCPPLWRNTAWWTWPQGPSTASAWLQWQQKERVLRLLALSTRRQRTWRVKTSNVSDLYW